jgi:hypothetical protein
MKYLAKVSLAVCFLSLAAATAALGQNQVTVDEFGIGTINGAPLAVTGVHPLVYVMPFPGVAGDVVMTEPGGGTSDVIDFDGQGNLWFYSDLDGPDSLADTLLAPILNNLRANTVYIEETGLWGLPYDEELNAGAYWTPLAGQPGYDAALQPQYIFISEIPEPGSLALLLGSLGAVALGQLRRKLRT